MTSCEIASTTTGFKLANCADDMAASCAPLRDACCAVVSDDRSAALIPGMADVEMRLSLEPSSVWKACVDMDATVDADSSPTIAVKAALLNADRLASDKALT